VDSVMELLHGLLQPDDRPAAPEPMAAASI
jgi:hypothetical protein